MFEGFAKVLLQPVISTKIVDSRRHCQVVNLETHRQFKITEAIKSGDFGTALVFVRERLAYSPEQTDVVHDLLAHLARLMTELNKARQKETRDFLKWLGNYSGLAVDEWKLKTIAQD